MKNKQYRLANLKNQLKQKRLRGIKSVVWKLTKEQSEYVEEVLKYNIYPILYRVKTRRINGYGEQNEIMKKLHCANKEGKTSIVIPLTRKDMNILDAKEIRYWPEKYKIMLPAI